MTAKRPSTDLSADQLRLLVRLDDGIPRQEGLGIRMSASTADDIATAEELKRIGLAEVVGGWNEVFWLRLTERGWATRHATTTA